MSVRSVSRRFTNKFQFTNGGLNYGFIEFDDPASAELAVENLNGRQILDSVRPG